MGVKGCKRAVDFASLFDTFVVYDLHKMQHKYRVVL